MLVLLIIFLITIPVVTQSIQLQLPKETNEVRVTKPENIVISVDAQGRCTGTTPAWPQAEQLRERLKQVSTRQSRSRRCMIRGADAAAVTIPWARSWTPASAPASQACPSSPSRPHSADRRDAGAADHADHHHPDPAALGESEHAGRRAAAAARSRPRSCVARCRFRRTVIYWTMARSLRVARRWKPSSRKLPSRRRSSRRVHLRPEQARVQVRSLSPCVMASAQRLGASPRSASSAASSS
jgi:hypothetical protein